jgi:hypothetical protein
LRLAALRGELEVTVKLLFEAASHKPQAVSHSTACCQHSVPNRRCNAMGVSRIARVFVIASFKLLSFVHMFCSIAPQISSNVNIISRIRCPRQSHVKADRRRV